MYYKIRNTLFKDIFIYRRSLAIVFSILLDFNIKKETLWLWSLNHNL